MNRNVAIKLVEGALVEKYDDVFGQAAHNTDAVMDRGSVGDTLSSLDVDVEHTDFSKFKIGGSLSARDKELKIPGFVNAFLISLKPLKYEKLVSKSQFLPGLEPSKPGQDVDKPTTPTYRFYFGEPELYVYAIYKDGDERFNLSRAPKLSLFGESKSLARYNAAPYVKRGEEGEVERNYESEREDNKADLAKRIDAGTVVDVTDKSKLLVGVVSYGYRRRYSHYGLVTDTSWTNLLAACEWVYKLPAGKVAHTADIRQARALSKEGATALERRSKADQETWYRHYDASGYPSRHDELVKKALEIRAKSPSLAKDIDDTVAELDARVREVLSSELTSGKSVGKMIDTFKQLTTVSGQINITLGSLAQFQKYPAGYSEKDVKDNLARLKNILIGMKTDAGLKAAGIRKEEDGSDEEESLSNREKALHLVEKGV